MFSQGDFQQTANETPATLARKRALIAAMMPQFGKARYVGEGLGQLFQGIGSGMQERKLDRAEADGASGANDIFSRIFGGGNSGGSSSGGSVNSPFVPQAPAAQPVDPNSPDALASDTMSAIGKGGTAEGIKAGLVARGMPEHIADGFVMNFQDESGLNPGINETSPTVAGSRGGFGLAQWTGPRRRSLEAFAAQRGAPASDAGVQMDFLMEELRGPEADAWSKISATPDSGQAAAAVLNHFERPAEEHRARREADYLGGQPAPPAQDMNQLYEAMANPFMSAEQKAVIGQMIAQGEQQADPSYQMGLQKQQLELDAMRNPGAPKPLEVNGQLIDSVTGEVLGDYRTPETQKPVARPLTDPTERAKWGIPETDKTPYSITDGEPPKPTGSGGQTINNIIGGADKFAEAWATGDAKTITDVYNSGLTAQRNLGRIDQLEGLLAASPTGAEGALKQAAGEWGINTDGLDAIQSAQAALNTLVPEQRPPGSGPMSDADLALFKQSLPRIINQPGGNQTIVSTMRAIAQYDAEGATIVQRMRTGELDRAGGFAALQNRVNPLSGFKASSDVGATGTPPAVGQLPTGPTQAVTLDGKTQADWDSAYEQLPSGTVFVGPDGVKRTKP